MQAIEESVVTTTSSEPGYAGAGDALASTAANLATSITTVVVTLYSANPTITAPVPTSPSLFAVMWPAWLTVNGAPAETAYLTRLSASRSLTIRVGNTIATLMTAVVASPLPPMAAMSPIGTKIVREAVALIAVASGGSPAAILFCTVANNVLCDTRVVVSV